MGLYIDMEMPQNCQSCNFYNGLGCKATGRMFAIFYNVATRRSDCPLTEVPEPHGRLIDADALRAKMYHEAFETDTPMQKWDSGCWIRYKMFEDMEESAPTIIPAESEGE